MLSKLSYIYIYIFFLKKAKIGRALMPGPFFLKMTRSLMSDASIDSEKSVSDL